MTKKKTGIWFIGAWGGVSTTVAVGLAGLQKGVAPQTGLVTSLPLFDELPLADWDTFIVGGHEIRDFSYAEAARELYQKSRIFTPELLDQVDDLLAEYDKNVQPGTLINVGSTIEALSSARTRESHGESPAAAVERIQTDLEDFQNEHDLEHVIVVNLASTEPPVDLTIIPDTWNELGELLEASEASPLPASSLYAIAAFQAGCSFVNFTPSIGADLPALIELAEETGSLHCGRDGKTGETLLKSVLAPMFAARNLRVQSWVGHNIFGNMDGVVLNDPINKQTKVRSKDHLLTEILGYKPQSLVSIEYIESLGDWKTAWDHIHFQGFLNTPMTMQFTWQGCDSILAAPLVLDLVRLTQFERSRGNAGIQEHLACFFKSPMGSCSPEFAQQFEMLQQWVVDTLE